MLAAVIRLVTEYTYISYFSSDSIISGSLEDEDVGTISTDSSIAVSRALTDSEIDYYRYRKLKNRSLSDPWAGMKAAMDAFPPDYLASLQSFQSSSTEVTDQPEEPYERTYRRNEELALKMERFFEEECRVFTPEDPGLLALKDALRDIDMSTIDSDLDSSITVNYLLPKI
ncbi:uncharacterized protein LOC128674546 isoform X2 [Plodia interpunctella]|uniref:uncharacterized protein LOC128674546 isoform X2 n=1 Tax=Plodia interpunctella TaxID=58824 RepID=UPI0023678689|nr:uncharacterized protein LOC128674546 isoform X2 [Plodia interpunctella]